MGRFSYRLTVGEVVTICAHGVYLDNEVKALLRRGVPLSEMKIEAIPTEPYAAAA